MRKKCFKTIVFVQRCSEKLMCFISFSIVLKLWGLQAHQKGSKPLCCQWCSEKFMCFVCFNGFETLEAPRAPKGFKTIGLQLFPEKLMCFVVVSFVFICLFWQLSGAESPTGSWGQQDGQGAAKSWFWKKKQEMLWKQQQNWPWATFSLGFWGGRTTKCGK